MIAHSATIWIGQREPYLQYYSYNNEREPRYRCRIRRFSSISIVFQRFYCYYVGTHLLYYMSTKRVEQHFSAAIAISHSSLALILISSTIEQLQKQTKRAQTFLHTIGVCCPMARCYYCLASLWVIYSIIHWLAGCCLNNLNRVRVYS